ncbi:MAG: nucleoside deaminase [Rubrobacteraceae bacterium]|nr:nucleoside deaminase [Rubrobacteraceae bacterium]
MSLPAVTIELPEWMEEAAPGGLLCPTREDRMRFVVALARENVHQKTGGPFGAAVFDRDSGRLIAPGVNLVYTANLSCAHAEIVALSVAQRILGSFDLGEGGSLELVTSTEPCAMCFGGVIWSGVKSLVCGAREQDARAIGFDEGPKVPDWPEELSRRGISIARDVCRAEAASVLEEYAENGGVIYNARR